MATNNATNTSNPLTVSQGGTGDSSFTAYAVITGGTTSTGVFQNVSGLGSSGQVLTSNGASALPTWQAAGSGGGNLVLIQSQTASSSATISFTSGITSTYNNYVFYLSNVVPATNTAQLKLVFSINGGSSYITSSLGTGMNYWAYNSTTNNNVNASTSFFISPALSTTTGMSGIINCLDITSGTVPLQNSIMTLNSTALATTAFGVGGGFYFTTATINAFQFSMSSGNIASGVFTLFGVLE
jgi:hypothetical protein